MSRGVYSLIKSLMIVFMAMILLSPNLSSALHQCQSHAESTQELAFNTHSEDSSASHHESHDCACPTHRVDCCHYQATPSLPKLNLVSVFFATTYGKKIFALPNFPLLDGPFQPPRA